MRITIAIISTTHVDRRGTRFAKVALDGMVDDIKATYVRYTKNHDPNQLLGVLLYGKVFGLSDGEFALGVVVGEYESDNDRATYVVGAPNLSFREYQDLLDIEYLRRMQEINSKIPDSVRTINLSELSLSESLALYIDFTRVSDLGEVYEIRQYVDTTNGLSIEVYPKDHLHEPHYHVVSKQRNINARFDAKTHQLMSMKSGSISSNDVKKVQKFFQSSHNQRRLDDIVTKMYKD